jgi:Domain of unknown function (DUF5679)
MGWTLALDAGPGTLSIPQFSKPGRYLRVASGAIQETRGVSMANYEGYCVKCREKREFDGEEVDLPNGRRAAQGMCPVCGTKMNRILGKARV